ncbi:hypothetical protein MLD38_037787 [Melastoma candidum]|uniref:Uncharacterized protein n=1 Tax=Melastoma candidum TaxID=119954 RepID=A0ACB9LN47_9MYRT|nr:hypothetical protein MLD38_037787 [Melastoma candidum]
MSSCTVKKIAIDDFVQAREQLDLVEIPVPEPRESSSSRGPAFFEFNENLLRHGKWSSCFYDGSGADSEYRLKEEVQAKLGKNDAECEVFREDLAMNDEIQELPGKHLFHPPCMNPWLICQNELLTDDHADKSWTEWEKEAEEERKDAADAVHGWSHIPLQLPYNKFMSSEEP